MNDDTDKDMTSPPDPTHEATTPPGNPETDQPEVEQAEEKLDQVRRRPLATAGEVPARRVPSSGRCLALRV